MSSHNRKRKYRQGHRSQGGGRRDYEPTYEEPKEEEFLAHHKAYLNSLAGSSSSPSASGSAPWDRGHGHVQAQERHHVLLQALYIQAYEADIVRGPKAIAAAGSLEVVEYRLEKVKQENGKEKVIAVGTVPKIGSALIRWGGNGARDDDFRRVYGFGRDQDEEEESWPPLPKVSIAAENDETAIWVDRYDARLLLDALPKKDTTIQPRPSSPTGWSDLPSDSEDTFFLRADEIEDFKREKRRRLLEQTREERLKARMEEDGDDLEEGLKEEDAWGGSDEEPDDLQKELMKRTATHLVSSPNTAQLEMRILANHGGDKRFAFLRGRWSRAWNVAKAKARKEKEEKAAAEESKQSAGLGVLTGYGSDDGSASEQENQNGAAGITEAQGPPVKGLMDAGEVGHQEVDEEAAKEARRKRLKAWKEQRKVSKHDEK